MAVLFTVGGAGPRVPGLLGLTYEEATTTLHAPGLFRQIHPTQDSSGSFEELLVKAQDPKPGVGADKDEVVTVTLEGLPLVGELPGLEAGEPSVPAPGAPEPVEPSPAGTPLHKGRTVAIDPGHSNRTGSETDPATGLNVGDNTGAAGELQSNWELAQKVKARLEQAGYTVRLTKSSADSYASLRERADIGNTCDIVVRLHFDPSGFTGVMRPPAGGARCPSSDPSRVTVVDANVAQASNSLATHLAAALGLQVRDDTGGTSQGNTTPAGHPTALIGSVLSRVPVVCIENRMELVRDNPSGQEQVAAQIVQGINAYFQ